MDFLESPDECDSAFRLALDAAADTSRPCGHLVARGAVSHGAGSTNILLVSRRITPLTVYNGQRAN